MTQVLIGTLPADLGGGEVRYDADKHMVFAMVDGEEVREATYKLLVERLRTETPDQKLAKRLAEKLTGLRMEATVCIATTRRSDSPVDVHRCIITGFDRRDGRLKITIDGRPVDVTQRKVVRLVPSTSVEAMQALRSLAEAVNAALDAARRRGECMKVVDAGWVVIDARPQYGRMSHAQYIRSVGHLVERYGMTIEELLA